MGETRFTDLGEAGSEMTDQAHGSIPIKLFDIRVEDNPHEENRVTVVILPFLHVDVGDRHGIETVPHGFGDDLAKVVQ